MWYRCDDAVIADMTEDALDSGPLESAVGTLCETSALWRHGDRRKCGTVIDGPGNLSFSGCQRLGVRSLGSLPDPVLSLPVR